MSPTEVGARSPTYYDLPVVKPPPWEWYIPAYFYVGGAAGVCALLAGLAQGRPEMRPLVVRGRWIAAVGVGVGSILLIADLGRPERFLNMMRVFRPTSPLNVGTWIIAFTGTAAGAATVLSYGPPPLRRVGDVAGAAAALSGPLLSTYTAVVLSNTAIPLWSRGRLTMPFLFAASSAASAAALLELVGTDERSSKVVERVGAIGQAGELVAMHVLEREIGPGRPSAPLRQGRAGLLWTAAKVLGAASLVATLWPGRSRTKSLVAGLLGTAAAISMRFALFEAGMESPKDPRATFEPQRDARR